MTCFRHTTQYYYLAYGAFLQYEFKVGMCVLQHVPVDLIGLAAILYYQICQLSIFAPGISTPHLTSPSPHIASHARPLLIGHPTLKRSKTEISKCS